MKPLPFDRFCAGYGFHLTPGQRVADMISFDGADPSAFDGADAKLAFEMLGGATAIPPIARQTIVWLKGRDIGASRRAGARSYQLSLTLHVEPAPGEIVFCVYMAPDARTARQPMNYARGMAKADADAGRIELVREGVDSFTIIRHDGVAICHECFPATAGGSAVRGRTLLCAVMTETAFFRDAGFVINDEDCYVALPPRIVDGGQIILESTPNIRRGLLANFYRDNFGDPKTALVLKCPTTMMRPDPKTKARVEAALMRNRERGLVEHFCDFLDGSGSEFFDGVAVGLAVDPRRPIVSYAPPGAVLGAGGDLALERNSSTLAIVARVGEHYELLEIAEKRPESGKPLKLGDVIRNAFAPVLQRHGLATFTADGHVREPAREFGAETKIEILGRELPITIEAAPEGNSGKVETYTLLQGLIREGFFKMPKNPRLEAQLRAVVSRPKSGGGIYINSPNRPDGSHGDLVSALVNAVWAARDAGSGGGAFTRPTRSISRYADMGGYGRG